VTLSTRRGHLQHGRRYGVIVQTNELLELSTIVICPTSLAAFPASFHPEITVLEQSTQVLCEMVGAIDAGALGERVGHLTVDEIRAIDDALELVLDLR
jgi:mRNA interferase MazF